jgi:phage FluMu protein Com
MPAIERTKLAACSACGNVKAVSLTGPSLAETCPSCKSIRAFRLIGWDNDEREFVLLPDRVS